MIASKISGFNDGNDLKAGCTTSAGSGQTASLLVDGSLLPVAGLGQLGTVIVAFYSPMHRPCRAEDQESDAKSLWKGLPYLRSPGKDLRI